FAAAVPVRMVKTIDGGTRHQEALQNAVVNCFHRLTEDAFVIVFVPAVQIDARGALQGRVESDGKEVGKNLFADAFGEGLAFGLILLAMAFDTVAEDLVKEDAGSPAGKNGGSDEGLGRFR